MQHFSRHKLHLGLHLVLIHALAKDQFLVLLVVLEAMEMKLFFTQVFLSFPTQFLSHPIVLEVQVFQPRSSMQEIVNSLAPEHLHLPQLVVILEILLPVRLEQVGCSFRCLERTQFLERLEVLRVVLQEIPVSLSEEFLPVRMDRLPLENPVQLLLKAKHPMHPMHPMHHMDLGQLPLTS